MMGVNEMNSPLFLGLTRPVMLWGVTMEYVMVAGMAMLTLCILSNALSWMLCYVPLHLVGWMGCQYDPAFFKVVNQWASLRVNPNQKIWGCRAYEPF